MTLKVVNYPSGPSPDMVLEQARGAYPSEVIVLGYDLDGEMDIRTSGKMTHEKVLFIIEHFKMKLMRGDYFDGEM